MEQSDLCLQYFQFLIMFRVFIELGDFRQAKIIQIMLYCCNGTQGTLPPDAVAVGTMATYIFGLC